MSSLLGFLGAVGNSLDVGDQQNPNALSRLNNAADPAAASQRADALQSLALNQGFQQLRDQGVTNPSAFASLAAQYSPDYAEKMMEVQAKNPLAAAFSNFNTPPTGGAIAPASAPAAAPAQDPYMLKPESPDDTRNYDFLNTKVPPQYRALIRQISNGDESVGNADSLRSNGLLTLASVFDPSLNKTDFTARQATAKDNSSGGKSGQAVTSANTAVKHLAQVALAGLDLHNGSVPLLNYIGNKESAWAGHDPVTNLESTVQTVAPELAKAAAGGGDTTEAERSAQKGSFGMTQSPEQFLGAVAGKADLINSKMQEVGNSYKNNMGGRERQTITPENKKILQDLTDLHQYAKDDKLDDPNAQAIVKRLRAVTGQPTTDTKTGSVAPDDAAKAREILIQRGRVKK